MDRVGSCADVRGPPKLAPAAGSLGEAVGAAPVASAMTAVETSDEELTGELSGVPPAPLEQPVAVSSKETSTPPRNRRVMCFTVVGHIRS